MKYSGKKILILGGAEVHCKVVRAAKELGIYTIVIDNLSPNNSPAKQIADESYQVDIYDIDGIVSLAKEKEVDGVINTSLDPCQIPQSKVCQRLGLYCYGTPEQYYFLTNKIAFKKLCKENGVDVIDSYSEGDVVNGNVKYPLFIKPVDSRGSRGQSICYNRNEALRGLTIAKSISTDGNAVIEQYLENKQDFTVTYVVSNGEPKLIRTSDRYLGNSRDGLDKIGALLVCPSKYSSTYFSKAHPKIASMIRNLGIKNGPVFFQGFIDKNTVRLYDPGLRLPGGNYENLFKSCTGKDIIKMLIEFSLTGTISSDFGILEADDYNLNGNYVANLFPMVRAGKISRIDGFDYIKNRDYIVSAALRHNVGDIVEGTRTVNQRSGEFNIKTISIEGMKNAIKEIYSKLKIYDQHNAEMSCSQLDIDSMWIGGAK